MSNLRLNNGSTYRLLVYMALIVIGSMGNVQAETRTDKPPMGPANGWSFSTSGRYLHQLETDIEDGGGFSVNRFSVQAGPSLHNREFHGRQPRRGLWF